MSTFVAHWHLHKFFSRLHRSHLEILSINRNLVVPAIPIVCTYISESHVMPTVLCGIFVCGEGVGVSFSNWQFCLGSGLFSLITHHVSLGIVHVYQSMCHMLLLILCLVGIEMWQCMYKYIRHLQKVTLVVLLLLLPLLGSCCVLLGLRKLVKVYVVLCSIIDL